MHLSQEVGISVRRISDCGIWHIDPRKLLCVRLVSFTMLWRYTQFPASKLDTACAELSHFGCTEIFDTITHYIFNLHLEVSAVKFSVRNWKYAIMSGNSCCSLAQVNHVTGDRGCSYQIEKRETRSSSFHSSPVNTLNRNLCSKKLSCKFMSKECGPNLRTTCWHWFGSVQAIAGTGMG